MKSFFPVIFVVLCCVRLTSQSPITVDVNDIAAVDEQFRFANASPLTGFDGTETGADYSWDFSALVAISHDTTSFVSVDETDPLYFFLWLISDIAQKTGSDIVNDLVTIEDVYNFYERSSDHYSQTGFAGTVGGIPLPIQYDDPETIFEFPCNYNDVNSSQSGFNIDIPGIATWIEHRDRINTVDGWGTLSTPSGNYDVLRMKSEIAITDTFIYDIYTIPVTYTSIEYRWIAKNNGIPVLQINANEIFGIETVTQVMYREAEINSAVQNQTAGNDFISVIQNPVDANLSFNISTDTPGPVEIKIMDIDGKLCLGKNFYCNSGENFYSMNTSKLTEGNYFIFAGRTGHIIAKSKFIKQ